MTHLHFLTDMIGVLTLVFVVGCVHGFAENAHLCDDINRLNCDTDYQQIAIKEVVCASNGKTYKNYCEYSQARCADPHPHMLYPGPCVFTTTSATVLTTQPTGPIGTATANVITTPLVTNPPTTQTTTLATTTADQLLAVFCASKNTINCSTDLDPVCGSDGNFYLNNCEFSKSVCDDNTLKAKPQIECMPSPGK